MHCSAFEIRNSLLLFYLHLQGYIISKFVGDKVHLKQLNGVAVVDGRGNALGAQASRKNEHVRAVGSSSADSYRTWCVLFHSCRSTALERPHYANLCVSRMLSYPVRLLRLGEAYRELVTIDVRFPCRVARVRRMWVDYGAIQ